MSDSSPSGKGFAALDSMVSDISEDIKAVERAAAAQPKTHEEPRRDPLQPESDPATAAPQASPTPSGSSSMGAAGWIIGAVVVLFLIVVGSSGNNSSSPSSAASYSAPSLSYSPAAAHAPTPAPSTDPKADKDKPPIGSNNVLSANQILYCQTEKIRIDAIESVVDSRKNGEIDQFNSLVNDYNSRCGEFRYRRVELQRIQQEVEKNRTQIVASAKREWVLDSIGVSKTQKLAASSKPLPKEKKETRQACVLDRECPGDLELTMNIEQLSTEDLRNIVNKNYDKLSTEALRVVAAGLPFQEKRKTVRPEDVLCMDGKCDPPAWKAAEQSSKPEPRMNQQPSTQRIEPSRDRENFRTCISGDYPSLCKHHLLNSEEAAQVSAAEKKANFRTCISGDYPSLCKHHMLTGEEASQVAAAERRSNFRTCISGSYPSLCKHNLLTGEEASQVAAAERRENYKTCISGNYPSLCKHGVLTSNEAARVSEAERNAGFR